MKKDLKGMSLSEMEALQNDLQKEIDRKAKVRAKIQKILDDNNMTAEELLADAPKQAAPKSPKSSKASKGPARKKTRRKARSKSKKAGKIPPKYRNPENPSETWAGRGRKPVWMVRELDKGKSMDDFLIKKEDS